MLQILPLSSEHVPEASALFIQGYQQQKRFTPDLPGVMQGQSQVEQMLRAVSDRSCALVAVDQRRVVAYIAWLLVDRFRGTHKKGAYVPEWGHACITGEKTAIYQALYRDAGKKWAKAGCHVHAITLFAHDRAAERAWYWNGFGLIVVDGIRPMQPLEQALECRFTIHKAVPSDAGALAKIDSQHWQHYSHSPIFMVPHVGKDTTENILFLERPKNSVWLAKDGIEIIGFIRFEGYDFDGVAILRGEDGVQITGAYIRPAYRGQKTAAAILNAALRDYQSRGFRYCAVCFESFNPEAASFWPRYFEPVCFSLLRVPEYIAEIEKSL